MSSYLQNFPSSPTYSMTSTTHIAPTVASLCIQTAPPLPKTIITQNDISTSIEGSSFEGGLHTYLRDI